MAEDVEVECCMVEGGKSWVEVDDEMERFAPPDCENGTGRGPRL